MVWSGARFVAWPVPTSVAPEVETAETLIVKVSVEAPLLPTVTETVVVPPGLTTVGPAEMLTTDTSWVALTVNVKPAVLVSEELVPVTCRLKVPVAAEAVAVRFRVVVKVGSPDEGVKVPVTPVPRPVRDKVTISGTVEIRFRSTVTVIELPWRRVPAAWLREMVKFRTTLTVPSMRMLLLTSTSPVIGGISAEMV